MPVLASLRLLLLVVAGIAAVLVAVHLGEKDRRFAVLHRPNLL